MTAFSHSGVVSLVCLTFVGAAALAVSAEIVVGGSEADRGVGVAQTADGGFVVVGVTQSTGAGGEDIYLVRFDSGKNVLWERTLGGPGDDDGWAVLETAGGGLIVGGFTNSEGAGGFDCTLIATDPQGSPTWSKTYGGAMDDRCWAVATTADGGYVLAGETASSGSGERDCYLIKTDVQGREIWSHTYGGEKDDRCFSVVAARDGGLVIAGQTYSTGAGDRDAWVLKTNREGRLLWSKTHGGEVSDVAHSVAAGNDGSYYVTGYTTSLAASPDDPMLLKFADDGTIEWSRVLELDGHNRTLTGAQAADGGLCLTGFEVAGSPPTGTALVVKVDDAGQVLWTTGIAATAEGQSLGYGVTGTADGGCAITGHTTKGSAGELDLLFAIVDADGRLLE